MAEVEPNQPISSAQYLKSSSTEADVAGALTDGVPGGDVDFYVFDANAGDVLTIDIDNGFKGLGVPDSVNTILAIFGPGPDYAILRMNDNNSVVDDGSTSFYDPRIDDFVAPRTGTYVVGVTSYPRWFDNGGETATSPFIDTGTYTLKVTGLSPAVQQIAIEIKPGDHDTYAPINLKSKGKIPVAILGSPQFSALDVDRTSLRFGRTGQEDSLQKCDWAGTDVNNDGIVDLVCHFDNQRAGFDYSDLEGKLTGRTKTNGLTSSAQTNGKAFEGRGWLKVAPISKK